MDRKILIGSLVLFSLVCLFVLSATLSADVQILNPKGLIAHAQRDLILTAYALMFVIVIPIFILAAIIGIKFREGSKNGPYEPERKHGKLQEVFWWIIPSIIVLILAVINWNATHALDPYKPLESDKKPLTIRVVALQWKWLFIYPEQNIATINYVQFPEQTPINFELTADAPMSSFWIPSLGGQIYAMTGMSTQLKLMADKADEYRGVPTEINGHGYAKMTFKAKSTSQYDFDRWVDGVRTSPYTLDIAEYQKLIKPTEDHEIIYYSSAQNSLYNDIMMKFMPPHEAITHSGGHE